MEPFTAESSALVLIDHQVGTMKLIRNINVEAVRINTIALARVARILDMPVVLTSSQEERVQGPLLPELAEVLPGPFAARAKRSGLVNAWRDPGFRSAVEATGRRDLIMAGVTTDVCLVFPAIDAVDEGYRVQAVMDASGSPFHLSEEMARRRMETAGVTLTATNTLLAELARDWSRPGGPDILAILFRELLPGIN